MGWKFAPCDPDGGPHEWACGNINDADGTKIGHVVGVRNGRLTAAAPDLLDACKAALARFEFMESSHARLYSSDNSTWIAALATAIATAEATS